VPPCARLTPRLRLASRARRPGGFYISPATDPTKNQLWMLLLEGGQWCWSAESCGIRSQRNPALITSTIWPPHMGTLAGIFDTNPRRKCVAESAGGRRRRVAQCIVADARSRVCALVRAVRERSLFAGANLIYAGYWRVHASERVRNARERAS
jgi:hypothetical protein